MASLSPTVAKLHVPSIKALSEFWSLVDIGKLAELDDIIGVAGVREIQTSLNSAQRFERGDNTKKLFTNSQEIEFQPDFFRTLLIEGTCYYLKSQRLAAFLQKVYDEDSDYWVAYNCYLCAYCGVMSIITLCGVLPIRRSHDDGWFQLDCFGNETIIGGEFDKSLPTQVRLFARTSVAQKEIWELFKMICLRIELPSKEVYTDLICKPRVEGKHFANYRNLVQYVGPFPFERIRDFDTGTKGSPMRIDLSNLDYSQPIIYDNALSSYLGIVEVVNGFWGILLKDLNLSDWVN